MQFALTVPCVPGRRAAVPLPVGFHYDEEARIILQPDEEVRGPRLSISLVSRHQQRLCAKVYGTQIAKLPSELIWERPSIACAGSAQESLLYENVCSPSLSI